MDSMGLWSHPNPFKITRMHHQDFHNVKEAVQKYFRKSSGNEMKLKGLRMYRIDRESPFIGMRPQFVLDYLTFAFLLAKTLGIKPYHSINLSGNRTHIRPQPRINRSLPSKETLRGHSDSSFRGEGYIQCCVGVRLCDMYSNQELAEIHFMYGKADGNAALARRFYQERYPQRQCPDRKTFVRLHYRL
ncbi:hypothetical protein ANN_26998 [Periplaneta americana]|uniref:DUF4817 domain-containing protein n=1 Tax=Periplaneta americana TaxID=6978 RepID=A0ABQ8RWZ3_PERAM|nr:hypothetical protein ANN_26998 [Periplaneta americana]